MPVEHPVPFLAPWSDVPIVFIDFETTGVHHHDRAVEVGLARFEKGALVAQVGSLLDPGMPIPEAASVVHGILDEHVAGKPKVEEFFATDEAKTLLHGAQPAAYNAEFDRRFVPAETFADPTWPWLDTLTLVRSVDAYVKGKGRHKLTSACERHGVRLDAAHRASGDAVAAGELFFALMPQAFKRIPPTIGELLRWTRSADSEEWFRFHQWVARQPKAEAAA